MDRLLLTVDKEHFERLVEEHGGTRQALDFLAIKVDQAVRVRRMAVRKRPVVSIEIPLRPGLLALFNRYCVEFDTTKTQVINNIIKKKKNPKK